MWVYHHEYHQDAAVMEAGAGCQADDAVVEPPQKCAKLQKDLLIAGGLE